jgi:hypothetical protein
MNKIIKPYLKPAFLICAAFLLIAASSKSVIIQKMGVILTKLPIPLQKPLEDFDFDAISPYKLISQQRIENHDIIEELGTEEYLQCLIEDTEAAPGSPTRICSLFITYYTGNPDTVPHVPDECYVGGGNKQVGKDLISMKIPNSDGAIKLDASRVTFERKKRSEYDAVSTFSRLYFFKVNGEYSSGKQMTRAIMGKNILGKYSYFSKVEWEFKGSSGISPNKDQIIEASEKMFSVILPILENDHWPDWEAANAADQADE